MATYFNATRMGLAVPLLRGGSVLVPPKGTIAVTPEDESSPGLRHLREQGALVRRQEVEPDPPKPEPELAKEAVVVSPRLLMERPERQTESTGNPPPVSGTIRRRTRG